MTALKSEIATYESMRSDLESEHLGKWALVKNGALVDVFADFDSVAAEAVRRFGRGPYLIRQIGAGAVTLPASMFLGPLNGPKSLRIL